MVQVEVLDVLHVGLLGPSLGGAVAVDERVGEDLVEPRPEVGAVLVAVEGAVRLQERLLHEVLGVGGVPGHAQGGGVQRLHVRHGELGESTPVGHGLHHSQWVWRRRARGRAGPRVRPSGPVRRGVRRRDDHGVRPAPGGADAGRVEPEVHRRHAGPASPSAVTNQHGSPSRGVAQLEPGLLADRAVGLGQHDQAVDASRMKGQRRCQSARDAKPQASASMTTARGHVSATRRSARRYDNVP